MNELDFVETCLTHRELFGYSFPMDNIIKVIKKKVHPPTLLSILSQLSYVDSYQSSVIFKGDLFKIIRSFAFKLNVRSEFRTALIKKAEALLQNRTVLFDQGLLNLWKYVVIYGSNNNLTGNVNVEEQYRLTLWLLLCLSDHCTKPSKELPLEIFQNITFNREIEFGDSMARTFLIYMHICRDESRFEEDYIDVGKDFETKYDFKIEEYFSFLFSVHARFLSKMKTTNGLLSGGWPYQIIQSFKETKLRDICSDTVKLLSFCMKDIDDSVKKTLENNWDFSFFYEKPLFMCGPDSFFPVHRVLLENGLTDLLFWKIRRCYSGGGSTFQSFYGRAFELYVQDLLYESCQVSPLPYEFIPEQKYQTQRGENRSPDAIVRLENKVLVVESKIQRLHFKDSVIKGDKQSIERDRVKMTVKPIAQACEEIKRLLDGQNPDIDLSGVEEVYVIAINYGMFPVIRPFRNKTDQDWCELKGINIPVYFFHGCIEDLEALACLIERRKPIFRVLKHKNNNFPELDFRNFFFAQRVPIHHPEYLNKRIGMATKMMKSLLC